MKRVIALLLACCLIVSALSVSVFAADASIVGKQWSCSTTGKSSEFAGSGSSSGSIQPLVVDSIWNTSYDDFRFGVNDVIVETTSSRVRTFSCAVVDGHGILQSPHTTFTSRVALMIVRHFGHTYLRLLLFGFVVSVPSSSLLLPLLLPPIEKGNDARFIMISSHPLLIT